MKTSFLKVFSQWHRWELPGNYPIFIVVMAVYHYLQIIWRILITPNFCMTYMTMNKYYLGEPVNRRIQPCINIIQDNNRVITIKKGKGKLPLFHGNVERVIPMYDLL